VNLQDQPPIAVIGAGTLGWQIALTFAAAGVPVHLHDISPVALAGGLTLLDAELKRMAAAGELTESPAAIRARVTPSEVLARAIAGVWLAIEAIPERLALKRAFYTELSALAGPDVIFASNSSSYKSRAFADVVDRPERLLNAHFYGRPWRRPAVELMTCGQTDPAVIVRLRAFLAACGLRPFVCRGESTGFLFNRIWHAVKQESLRVVAEGHATPAEIDALWQIVMGADPDGPFARMDRVGLDVVLDIERHYAAESGHARDEPPPFLAEMVAAGRLGVKTGRGFYDYEQTGEDAQPSVERRSS
jgi:3-hydroxybutyryl-CoA dehydrogenase